MIPNRLPSTANVPTAAIADARRRRDRRGHELEQALGVVQPEQRERRDDEDVRDRDREARLDEDLEPVAATDRDDPGEAADEDVGRVLQLVARVGHRPAEDGDDDRDQRRDAGVEEDRQQHPGRGRRDDEREARAAGRRLQQDRRADDDQGDEQHRVRPVPQLAPEPPDPGEAEGDDEDREEEPATQPGDVGLRVAQVVLVDRLELLGGDLVAAPDDRLVELHLDGLGLDAGGGPLPGGVGQVRAEEGVRDDQGIDDRGRERPLVVGEAARHLAGQAGPGVRDHGLAELRALGRVEDPRRLGADRGPLLRGRGPGA